MQLKKTFHKKEFKPQEIVIVKKFQLKMKVGKIFYNEDDLSH
jgi:hypothetical protein